MKKTKILSIIMVMAMVISLVIAFDISASAGTNGFCGDPIANANGASDVWWKLEGTTLTIGGSGAMDDFSGDPDDHYARKAPWYDLLDDICTVVIENGVTNIGSCAFLDCTWLSSVTIPSSVTSIGHGAFWNCQRLTSLNIPDSVTTIGESVFYDSPCGETVDGVIYVGKWVRGYDNSASPENVTFRDGTKGIIAWAFSGCESITSVTIPGSVKSIGDGAFNQCANLTKIIISEGVTSIGAQAFKYCGHKYAGEYKELTVKTAETDTGNGLPSTITRIGSGAFYDTSLTLSSNSDNGICYIGNWAVYRCYGNPSQTCNFEIKEGTVGLADYVFGSSNCFTGQIPASVRYIGAGAISAAYQYTPGTPVVNVFNENFWSDSSGVVYTWDRTELVACPSNLSGPYAIRSETKIIGEYAFYNCIYYPEVIIPNGVTTIKEGAFQGYITDGNKRKSLVIPKSVTKIECNAFRDAWLRDGITFCNENTIMEDGAFYHAQTWGNMTPVYYPNATTNPNSAIARYVNRHVANDRFEEGSGHDYVYTLAPGLDITVGTISDEGCQIATKVGSGTISSITVRYRNGTQWELVNDFNGTLAVGYLYRIEATVLTSADDGEDIENTYTAYVNLHFVDAYVNADTKALQTIKNKAWSIINAIPVGNFSEFVESENGLGSDLVVSQSAKTALNNAITNASAKLTTGGVSQIEIDRETRALTSAYNAFVKSIRFNLVDKKSCPTGIEGSISGPTPDELGVDIYTANAKYDGISYSFTQGCIGDNFLTSLKSLAKKDEYKSVADELTAIANGLDENSSFDEIIDAYKKAKALLAKSKNPGTDPGTNPDPQNPLNFASCFTVSGKTITWSIPNVTVEHIYYTGANDTDNLKNYFTLTPGNTGSAYVLGATTHTFIIVATHDGKTEECTVTIPVSTPRPVVVNYGGAVGIFYYGASVEWVAYAQGEDLDANGVREKPGVTYTAVNSVVSIGDFTPNTTYTFCFKTANGAEPETVTFTCPAKSTGSN